MGERNVGRRYRSRRSTSAEWAWAAGLFEGEGSILRPQTGQVRLVVKMTDEDVVCRLASIAGGTVYGPYRYAQPDGSVRKAAWVWTSDGVDVRAIARQFAPWMGRRRAARIRELALLAQEPLFVAG